MTFKAIFYLASLTLVGCLDSGSDSNLSEEFISFDGKVADGYLVNAKVCLDLNDNSACDSTEPYATSSAGGDFSLSGVTQSQVDNNPILVEVIAGETYDEDENDPNIKIQTAYKLSAPAGSDFVSPITTILKSKMDAGASLADAITEVKTVLGNGFDPTRDYVAAQENNELTQEERDLYEKGHNTAKVIAGLLANELNGAEPSSLEDAAAVIEQKLVEIGAELDNDPNANVDDIVDAIDSTVLNSANLAGIWVGDYLNDTSGSIAGAYILRSNGTGMFLDGYENTASSCTDFEMEFTWSLSNTTLNLIYTGIEDGVQSGDGAADPESFTLTEFTGTTVMFPPKEVSTGSSSSVTLTKKLTRSDLSESAIKNACSAN